MRLNIGNATKQNHDFLFRMPGLAKVNVLPIPKGSQVHIEGNREDLDFIIAQHVRYGLIDVKEFGKQKNFAGLVFSFNGTINMDKLAEAREIHNDFIDENAQNIREATTAASAAIIEGEAEHTGAKVGSTTFELEELPDSRNEGKTRIKQTLIADKSASEKRSTRRRSAAH